MNVGGIGCACSLSVTRYRLAGDDLTALSAFLGEKPYFFGAKPTEFDATAYGFLAQVLWTPGSRQVREHLQQTRNLPALCERIKLAFYGIPQA